MPGFEGLPRGFFRFFADLERHNDRDWFKANRDRYDRDVVAPMMRFIEAVAPRLKSISPHYLAIAKPHGGSMFRIYRDTRFSNDKTPYKTHAACHFRHEAGKDAHAPGFYAHFERDNLHFGGGIWRPPAAALGDIREAIVDNPAAWRKIGRARPVSDRGGIRGDGLVNPPRGYDPDHEHVEDLKRKSFYVMTETDPALAASPDLVGEVARAFRAAAPLNRFVCQALGLPF